VLLAKKVRPEATGSQAMLVVGGDGECWDEVAVG